MGKFDFNFNANVDGKARAASQSISEYRGNINGLKSAAISENYGRTAQRGHISSANSYFLTKMQRLDNSSGKLSTFGTGFTQFEKNAKAADKRVASYINKESENLYKALDIKTGWAKAWEELKNLAVSVAETVKDWVANNWQKIAGWAIGIAAAVLVVVTCGAAAAFIIGFALSATLIASEFAGAVTGYSIENGLKSLFGEKWGDMAYSALSAFSLAAMAPAAAAGAAGKAAGKSAARATAKVVGNVGGKAAAKVSAKAAGKEAREAVTKKALNELLEKNTKALIKETVKEGTKEVVKDGATDATIEIGIDYVKGVVSETVLSGVEYGIGAQGDIRTLIDNSYTHRILREI